MQIALIDALARAHGKRYATFDVVGAGPRIVAGIAMEFGNVDFYPYEKALSRIRDIVEKDIVLISAMSSDYHALRRLVVSLRKLNFRKRVIVGGPVGFDFLKVLSKLPVDIVVIGEAEIPLKALLEKLNYNSIDLSSVPAIAYVDNGVVKVTSKHIHTPKYLLNEIKPWTFVEKAFEHPQVYRFYVEVVRGCSNFRRPMINLVKSSCIKCHKCKSPILEERLECPMNIPPGCGFCSVPYMFGPPRSRSVKSIVEEISDLIKHGARRIVLSAPDFLDYGRDDAVKGPLTDPCTPPANIDAIEKLLCELNTIEEVKSGKAVIMVENIKACLVDNEVGHILGRYLKNTTVHIGLETGCDWYNEKVLGKPIKVKHVINASKILKEHGLRPYIYLVYGLPKATREVYAKTMKAVDKLIECGVEKITLYKYINLASTAFEELKPEATRYLDLINNLKKRVEKYNLLAKRKFLHEIVEVYLYEVNGKVYGYPVKHGPVVFVEKTRPGNLCGCRGLVEITDVSARFMKGVLISVLEC